MLRVSSTKALCRAAAAGFLLSAVGWSQDPALADPQNRIGVSRPEWGGETREEHSARMAADQKAHPTLGIGAPIPDFNLKGADGKFHAMHDYDAGPILAVLFICNHCPASQIYEGRIKKIVEDYGPKGVQIVAIQPNGPQAVSLRELNYTDLDDSYESMVLHAQYRHFNFPYLYDGDTQEVVARFGPKVTPHIFIFDRERKLRFEGRIDDNLREARVRSQDTRNALDSILAGRPVPVEHTPVFGCDTKWNSQIAAKQREQKVWDARPVTLETIGVEGLQKLRTNPTGKTLMINFWATWCGPCVAEFHDLITTYLWYRSRDFELITVSTNTPDERAAVQKFLEEQHSALLNYQFDSDDTYALQAAFDKRWDSGVPYTIVLAPDGKVIYEETGEISLLDLRRAILGVLPDGGFAGNAAYWAQK
jgi:thiol-disulfide isomerase/thioredoxin